MAKKQVRSDFKCKQRYEWIQAALILGVATRSLDPATLKQLNKIIAAANQAWNSDTEDSEAAKTAVRKTIKLIYDMNDKQFFNLRQCVCLHLITNVALVTTSVLTLVEGISTEGQSIIKTALAALKKISDRKNLKEQIVASPKTVDTSLFVLSVDEPDLYS